MHFGQWNWKMLCNMLRYLHRCRLTWSMVLDWAKFLMVLSRTLYSNQSQNLWSNGRLTWTLLFRDQWSSFWHPVSAGSLIVYRDATLLTIHRQQRWFQKMTHLNDNSKMCFHVVTNLDQSRLQLRHSQSKYSETPLLSF